MSRHENKGNENRGRHNRIFIFRLPAVVTNTGGANTAPLTDRSKLALGTIKNGFRASDLPPEGPKKERRGNSSNLSKSQN